MQSAVEVENVRVIRGGRTILDVDRLEVKPSEILAIIGPNGAGKSTLMQVLGLLLQPDEGRVSVNGKRVRVGSRGRHMRKMACVFQSPLLLDRSVRSNIELGLKLRRVGADEREAKAEFWILRLGLQGVAERNAHILSGGEAQRVNIARAMALEPEILLMDEAFTGLDMPTRLELLDELGPMLRKRGIATVLVTHNRAIALSMGDRLAVMLDGRIRQVSSPEEVFLHPSDLDVASFIGMENILPCTAKGTTLELNGGPALEGLPGVDGQALACLRAEELRLGPPTADENGWNLLQGRIARIFPRDEGMMVELDLGCRLLSRLSRAEYRALNLSEGQSIDVRIRYEAVHRIEPEK